MRGKKGEARQALQCVPLVPLLPAPNCLFLPLHESPFRSCFKNPTFNVLSHEGKPSRSASMRGTPILLPVPSSRHLSDSKVFPSFVTVFMKTKVAPFKISHLLGAASPGLSGSHLPETDHRGGGRADYNRQPIKVQRPLQAPEHHGVIICGTASLFCLLSGTMCSKES